MSVIVGYERGQKQGACNPATNTALPNDKTGVDTASRITGTSSLDSTSSRIASIQPTGRNRFGVEVVSTPPFRRLVQQNLAQTTNGTTSTINVASHQALVGDLVVAEAFAVNASESAYVAATTATTITLAQPFTSATQSGDTYSIFRPQFGLADSSGIQAVNASITGNVSISGPVPVGAAYTGTEKVFAAGGVTPDTGFGSVWDWYSTVQELSTGQFTKGPVPMGYSASDGQWYPIPVTGGGFQLEVNASVAGSVSLDTFTQASSLLVGGSLSAALGARGCGAFVFTGTFTSAQLAFEYFIGSVWQPLEVYPFFGAAPVTTVTISSESQYSFVCGPATQVRVRLVSLGSGTIVARLNGSPTAPILQPVQPRHRPITWGAVTRTTIGTTGADALAANANRRGLTLFCESTGQLFWCFGSTASATNYQGILQPGQGLSFNEAQISTQNLSVRGSVAAVNYTVCEAT